MSPHDFEFLRKLLQDRSGLALSADKHYLLESRLLPIARRIGASGLGELAQRLRVAGSEALATEVVEAMTTNESFFFRDRIPFEHFRDTMMPALLAARAAERRLRIWCTAASTGQEPYSLAIMLKEMAPRLNGWRVDIVATDLAQQVLAKATSGIYSQFEVQRGLPIHYLLRYFSQIGDTWQIAPGIRAMVEFRQLNLLRSFRHLGTFDVVFCRNVLIYLRQETKVEVLERIAQAMPPDGFLTLGAAETVVGLTDRFRPLGDKRGLYVPNAGLPVRRAPPLQSAAAPPALKVVAR